MIDLRPSGHIHSAFLRRKSYLRVGFAFVVTADLNCHFPIKTLKEIE